MSSDLSSDLTSDLSVIVSIPATQDPRSKISRKLFLDALAESWMHPRSKIPRKFFLDAGWKSWMHPRSKISRKLFLDALAESWMHPRSWILGLSQDFQDFQEKFSGNLGSWILGASKISSLHPRKKFWESWILDLRWQALRLEFRLKFRLEISVHMCRQKLSDKQCPCASV